MDLSLHRALHCNSHLQLTLQTLTESVTTAVPFFNVIPPSHMLLQWFHFIIPLHMFSAVFLDVAPNKSYL